MHHQSCLLSVGFYSEFFLFLKNCKMANLMVSKLNLYSLMIKFYIIALYRNSRCSFWKATIFWLNIFLGCKSIANNVICWNVFHYFCLLFISFESWDENRQKNKFKLNCWKNFKRTFSNNKKISERKKLNLEKPNTCEKVKWKKKRWGGDFLLSPFFKLHNFLVF